MKKMVALLLALVMVFGLVACGNQTVTEAPNEETPTAEAPTAEAPKEEASTTEDNYTLRIATIPADVVINYINLAAESFREKYPEFQVEIVAMPYEEYIPQAPRILGSEDNGFDMAWMQRELHWKSMADDGMFLVINDIYEELDLVNAVGEGVANLYKNSNGDYVGLCDDVVWIGNVFYNKAIFEELNLSIPTTYEEMIATCDTIAAAGYIPIAAADLGHTFWTLAERFLTAEEYDKLCDPATAASIWESDSMLNLLEEYDEFSNKYLQEGIAEGSSEQTVAEFLVRGEAAMGLGINAIESPIQAIADESFEYGYFCFPDYNRTARVLSFAGNSMEILASTDQPELAKEFLAHYMSVEMQSALAESGWLWPSRSDLDSEIVAKQPEIRQQQLADMSERSSTILGQMRMSAAYTQTVYECLADMLVGSMSAEDAAATIAAAVESE